MPVTTVKKQRKLDPTVPSTPMALGLAGLAAQVVAAPKPAAKAARSSTLPAVLTITSKGLTFKPCGKSDVSKNKDTVTWAKLSAELVKAENNSLPLTEIMTLVGDHRSYVGYAVRRGWLAAA